MSHFTNGRNVTCVWLNGEGGEAAVQGIVLGEAHVNGIFDVPCCGAEPKAEEDAALSDECARNAAEDMTGDAEGHGKRMEECKIGKRTRSVE